jgi:hypothetical protein
MIAPSGTRHDHHHHRPRAARSTGPISSSPPSRSAATGPAPSPISRSPSHGLRQTIADTLGVGGIMRGLRTVPASVGAWPRTWPRSAPTRLLLQYVNPMAINTWALAEKPSRAQAGRPVPFGAEHGRRDRPRPRPARRRDPLPRRRGEPRRLLPEARARGPRPLSRPARGLRAPAACPNRRCTTGAAPTACATR